MSLENPATSKTGSSGSAAGYDHMIILDADSLMTADTIVRLASAMESFPTVALIQTLPIVVNAKTLFARLQQFSGRFYTGR